MISLSDWQLWGWSLPLEMKCIISVSLVISAPARTPYPQTSLCIFSSYNLLSIHPLLLLLLLRHVPCAGSWNSVSHIQQVPHMRQWAIAQSRSKFILGLAGGFTETRLHNGAVKWRDDTDHLDTTISSSRNLSLRALNKYEPRRDWCKAQNL